MNNYIDDYCIRTLKVLGAEMITKAKSGHPGIVLGAAPIAHTLFTRHINIDPNDEKWFNRDRFVLSAGHGSALLYMMLHLSGYNVNSVNALSSSQRKYILESMLYNNIMSKNEIIRYLAYFIRVNGAKKSNDIALKKWQEDLDFVQSIDLEKQPQYYIDIIEKY